MRRTIRSVLAAILVLASLTWAPVAASGADVSQVVGSFETATEGWSLGLGNEFPGAKGTFGPNDADARVGAYSGLLTADFTGGGNYVETRRDIDLDATGLRWWTRSPDLTQVVLRMTDSTGQVHQQRVALAPGGGWQHLSVGRFDGGSGYLHFGGANDGVWHGPAKRVAFLLDKGLLGGRTSGQVRFDDVVVTAAPPDLTLLQVRPGNVSTGTEPVELRVQSRGDTVVWNAYDHGGNRVANGQAPISGEVTLRVPVTRVGYYRLEVTATLSGAPIATKTTTAALLAPFDTAAVADSPFGMATHFSGTPELELVPLLAKAGAKNLREDAYWSSIEQTKGQYGFSRYDPLQAKVAANGMRWLPITAYTNPHYDDNATPHSDAGRAGFANYSAATATRYRDQVRWMEVYNEFNIPGFGDRGDGPADARADYYYPLLKATYEKTKATTPGMTVVGAVTAGVPLDWLEQLFQLGGLRYMDVVSVHPYVYPADPQQAAQSLANLKELIKRYNGGQLKPIWISEQGWPTHVGGSGVSEATQAAYIVRSHVVAFSQGVQRYFWYDFVNDGLTPTYNEHNFGIVRNGADPAGRWTPKPAYASYAAMTRQLTGAAYQRQETVADGVFSHVFDKGGTDTRVVWSTTPRTLTAYTSRPVTVTTLTGHSATYQPDPAGRVHLAVSGEPIYVTGDGVRLGASATFALAADNGGTVLLGDPVGLTFTVDNTRAPRIPLEGALTVAGQRVPFSVRPGERTTIPVTVADQGTAGRRDLVGDLTLSGRRAGRLAASADVRHPFDLTSRHVARDGGESLVVTVANRAGRDLPAGQLTWRVGDRSGSVTVPSPVPAGGSRTVDIPLDGLAAGRTHPSELRLAVPDFPELRTVGRVVMVGEPRPFPNRTVVVDGVPDDLTGVPAVDLATEGRVQIPGYGGPADLSGKVWVTWDADHLYLSARVRDDTHLQPATGDRIWSGDSIQFAFAGGMPGEHDQWYEYGVALTSAGPQVHRWLTAGGPPGPVTDVAARVTRDDTAAETVYELALPWRHLTPFLPADRLLSLSLLVNDNDDGTRGYVEWGSGIGSSKDPTLFKAARLA